MSLFYCQSLKQKSGRAFTLIEASIVLSIVGLVIAALWVAHAKNRKDILLNKEVQGILQIVQNVRSLYRSSYDPSAGQSNISDIASDAGLLAGTEGFTASTVAGRLRGPDGGLFYLNLDSNGIKFGITITSTDDCIRLVSKLTSVGKSEFSYIIYNGSTWVQTFPTIPTPALCTPGTELALGFKF